MCQLNKGLLSKSLHTCFHSKVAIKSIRKERITDDLDRIHIQREVEITSSLRHPNITRFYEGKTVYNAEKNVMGLRDNVGNNPVPKTTVMMT